MTPFSISSLPPSSRTTLPSINDPALLDSHRAVPTMSSSSPARPAGVTFAKWKFDCGSVGSVIAEGNIPGDIAFTRTGNVSYIMSG